MSFASRVINLKAEGTYQVMARAQGLSLPESLQWGTLV